MLFSAMGNVENGRSADGKQIFTARWKSCQLSHIISQYPEEAAKLMKIADDMRKDLGDNLTRVKGPGRREPGKLK